MKKLLFSFISILVISCFSNAKAQISVGPGNVSGTWTASSHYQVNGDISVASGDTLNIQPGVTVEFMGHFRLTVHGHLFALGAEGDSIRFTKADTNGLYDWTTTAGSWNGIRMYGLSGQGEGHLSYCVVEFSNTYEDLANVFSEIAAVDMEYGSLILENSVIRYNYSYAGGTRASYGECEIRGNLFYKNYGYYWGGGLSLFTNNANKIVEGNTFLKNKATQGGGIFTWRAGLKVVLKNNFISQNEAISGGGIYITVESGPQMVQNIIVNNTASTGGGIHMSNCGKVLVNNTICNNYASSGGGIYLTGPTLLNAANNILWGNQRSGGNSNQIYISSDVTATFRNTVMQNTGFPVEGTGTVIQDSLITGNPSIINPTAGTGKDYASLPADWKISNTSSCLNIGTRNYYKVEEHTEDFFGEDRIKYGIIDIGAHEFSQPGSSWAGTYGADYVWMADTIKITGDVTMDGTVQIVPGVVVKFMGYYRLNFNAQVTAVGNSEAPILFTIFDSTGFADKETTNGRWEDIWIRNADQSEFRYCSFEYGEGIDARDSDYITIEHCRFENCMTSGALIYTGSSNHIYIRNNTIGNNNTVSTSWLTYIMDGYYSSDLYIEHNRIFNNHLQAIQTHSNNSYIHNNLLYNNTGGIHLGEGDNVYIFNNTIANNNHWGISFGKGTGIVANNILWENEDSDLSTLPYVDELRIYNNILQDEPFYADYLIYEDNIIADPLYKNPYPGFGPVDDIGDADYSVLSISPAINMGRNSISGHNLPLLDIEGNNRILDGVIDIGAFEHTGQKPVITTQPTGGNICQGFSKVLSIVTEPEDTLLYQWQKDGENIPGATGPVYVKDPIMLQDAGNYRCMISNSFGTTYSDQVYVNVSSSANILTESTSEWIPSDEVSTFSVNATGSMPIAYQWYKDGVAIAGATIPELQISSPDSSDEGIYSCIVSNACGIDSTEAIQVFLIPQICMVTVDEISGQNLIVWEKKTKAPIFTYNIYRESTAAGIYDHIGTVPFDDLSEFEDSIADPKAQAYLYKITVTDTDGNETDVDLCRPHKTIHLLVSTHPEYLTSQLGWDNYYGFEYLTYIIYRSSTGVDFAQVQEISSSLNSWTDNDTVQGDLYYRIAVEKPESCDPEGLGKKAGTGPYNHSLSNLDNNKLRTNVRDNYEPQARIFPNPFTHSATLQFPNPEGKAFTLIITDLSGKVQRIEHNITQSSFVIERKSLEKGYYLFELKGDTVYRGKMVVE